MQSSDLECLKKRRLPSQYRSSFLRHHTLDSCRLLKAVKSRHKAVFEAAEAGVSGRGAGETFAEYYVLICDRYAPSADAYKDVGSTPTVSKQTDVVVQTNI